MANAGDEEEVKYLSPQNTACIPALHFKYVHTACCLGLEL